MPRDEPGAYAALVRRIYEAALEPRRWPDVVEQVLPFVHAKSGILFTPFDRIDSPGFSFPVNVSEDFLQLYANRYQSSDPWALATRDAGVASAGNVVDGDEIVPRKSLLASPFYREFLRPQNTSRICVAFVFGGDEQPGVLNTALTVHRGIRSRPFSARSKERMRLLVPHLSRALGVMFRLRDAELKVAATRGALDRLAGGVLLIDSKRRVIFANRAAARVLAERDGLWLDAARGDSARLAAATKDKTANVDDALATALAPAALDTPHFSIGVRVPRSAGRGAILLNVSSLPADNRFGAGEERAHAIVFLADSAEPPAVNTDSLKRVYALTDAELRVVVRICAGEDVREAARTLGIGEPTVRSHLRSAFGKTGTRRQAELVKLALSISSTLR